MSNRQIEAILRISSRLGSMAALKTLQRELTKVQTQATMFNRTNAAMTRGLNAAWLATSRAVAPAAAAYATAQAYRSFAATERQIERIGITADATAGQTANAAGKLRDLARDLHLPFQEVVDGADAMVASGKSLDETFALLPAVGRTAQASGAALSDMATTADAIAGSFGIAADRMQNAFDILAYGGKAGKFELRDMARELPSLAPAFAALGYSGEEGLKKLTAGLQIVRTETGTSAEAATAFMDVISKLESETLVNNFKKFGVNYRREMERAKKSGEDTLEAFVRISREAVKGDLSKLPQLFTDRQMLIGARALINSWDEFNKLVASTSDAAGTVEKDFARVSKNTQASIDDMANAWSRLVTSFGGGVAPIVTPALQSATDWLERDAARRNYLTGQGMGFMERAGWGMTATPAQMRDAEWKGGFRSADERRMIEGYGAYAASRTATAAMPVVQPIPTPRPDGPVPTSNFEAEWDRQRGAQNWQRPDPTRLGLPAEKPRPFPAGASPRDAERESMQRLRSDPNGIADAIDEALSSGGRNAKDSIEEAARRINEAGAEGGSAFARMLEGVGKRIGEEAAASFRANVGTIRVNADVGRSGAHLTQRGGPQ
jgi:TP901 family phage tail tape measure protein